MEFIKTAIDGVYIVEPKVFGDHRGFFMESYSKRVFEEAGLHYDFVQDNHSSSTVKGTLRGIHFQRGDKAQAKLVRCVRDNTVLRVLVQHIENEVAADKPGAAGDEYCLHNNLLLFDYITLFV